MKFVLAGGGTGGHLFPALALAEELKKRDKDVEVLFIGGRGGIEERVVPRYGYRLELLEVEALKNKTGVARFKSLGKAFMAIFRSISLLRKMRPDGVVGSGSYSAGPVVLAAKLLGIKTAILEQNVLPGFTNRFVGRFVGRVYIAFEGAAKYFPPGKTKLLGTPIRREIVEAAGERDLKRDKKFTLFVFGGSQGAKTINAAFLDATEYLVDIWPSLRVIHQSGHEGFTAAATAYRRKNLKVELHEFIDDMASAYASADLVICRAGATTLAEVTAVGLASILVPYPFAADGHQKVNARYLEEKGAAIMIDPDELTGATLAKSIRRLFESRDDLRGLTKGASELGRLKAASSIADDYMDYIEGRA